MLSFCHYSVLRLIRQPYLLLVNVDLFAPVLHLVRRCCLWPSACHTPEAFLILHMREPLGQGETSGRHDEGLARMSLVIYYFCCFRVLGLHSAMSGC